MTFVMHTTTDQAVTPTRQSYSELEQAYAFFNGRLFDGRLPACLITLQRKNRRTHGYFHGERFIAGEDARTDEIAMNPMHFRDSPTEDVLATLVHEMAHLQQHHFGKPSRGSYHNKQWGRLMEAVGLMPSNTGAPGGKRTGQRVTHYIIPGGRFAKAVAELLATGFSLTWADGLKPDDGGSGGKRQKFLCVCGLAAWAKPDARLICGDCMVPMQPV